MRLAARVAAIGLMLGLSPVGLPSAHAQGKLSPIDEAGYKALLAREKGKVVLVEFWATWCKPCLKEMPELVKIEQKLRARGFRLVTISNDEPEREAAALKILQQFAVPQPSYMRRVADEDRFSSSVDAKWEGALPALFLYDRVGRKVQAFIGETPTKEIEAAIEKLF